ncbi:hypothetical protein M1247_18675 [Mycobacterium sp. 21AC1]|uniref:protein UsfY n=1 Tax=[Mycobacterium] appelbergii TaxID=2939269 RepID=UPI0029394553|nr:protein UsfY [Mycobacterium sp. 21AC1]MDV3126954.1 hypothetical protein [Mycobacterium sp. 21AC1]
MKSPEDPVDHARTTRPHAGESLKDTKNMPAFILLGVALVSFVAGLAAFATDHHGVGVTLSGVAVIVFAASMVWFALAHRRVRQLDQHWYDEHPDTPKQEPSS